MIYKNTNTLEQLFGVKAKILKLFLQHPQLILSNSSIVKRANIGNKEAENIVTLFVKAGILKKINGHDQKKIKKVK